MSQRTRPALRATSERKAWRFLIAFMVSAAGCAVNAAFLIAHPNPWSLGGTVFCGSLTVWNLALEVRR